MGILMYVSTVQNRLSLGFESEAHILFFFHKGGQFFHFRIFHNLIILLLFIRGYFYLCRACISDWLIEMNTLQSDSSQFSPVSVHLHCAAFISHFISWQFWIVLKLTNYTNAHAKHVREIRWNGIMPIMIQI